MKKYYALLASISFLCLSLGSHSQSIIRGPYLQMGTPSSMVIKWRTSTPTSSQVWYGTSPSSLNFTTTENGSRTDHEVTVSGLPANSTFYYAVGNTAGQLMTPSNDHYFRTSPVPGSNQKIRVWVLGDAGKATQNQRDVRDAFYNFNGSQRIDMILLLGDNAYEEGTDAQHQVALFENMYEDKLINTPMYPTMGNHDSKSSESATQSGPYFEIFTMPTNGEAGGTPSGTEAYYSFDYGNIHFIVLDSDDTPLDVNDPMYSWLSTDIANTNQQWKVVFFHYPPYTETDSDTDAKGTAMRENYLPVLEAHGVDLVLVGHAHNYERSYLINGHYDVSSTFDPATMALDLGDGRPDGDGAYQKTGDAGTVYVVSGSAGSSAGAISNEHPAMHTSLGEKGSFFFEVTGNQMDLTFIRENGLIQDYFTISKQAIVGVPPTVLVTAPANGAHYNAPQMITITADAADSDGSIAQLDFLVNGISIGTVNQAPFSVDYGIPANGAYEVQAIATDNDDNAVQSSVVSFTVGPVSVCSKVNADNDDAEQDASGSVGLGSSDLELMNDGGNQTVGLRFNGLNIPPGATITEAHVQFTVDEATNDNPCSLNIYGQASANAPTFTSDNNDVSSRPRTSATVNWQPADWLAVGDAAAAQQTPDIAAIIQEIVNQPAYTAGSSIALILEGEGRRTAESFDGSTTGAPELCVQYSLIPPDCPALAANFGDPCNDGDNTTINDAVDNNCNCTGTPTACTGIGDADGDGVCADVDCDDNDPGNTHQPGDACDDSNLATINDAYDSNCNCIGVLNDCPGIGDDDGDGICSDVDCDDNDPTNTSQAGDACDDGDNTTINDVYNANCSCTGTPTACTGIGDFDGDGICSDVDCDDNDPNNTAQPGDACNDGDPGTTGETIQADCSCGGGVPVPTFTCVRVSTGDDDGEERNSGSVSLSSSDLELVEDPSQGAQVVGMRFTGLNLPQGAVITGAYLQFTADETGNTNPCNLTIRGQASDDAMTFSSADNDISSRQRTGASVNWTPPNWVAVGDAGPAQQTPDLASIIQEIVNRNEYTSNSAIALIIEGAGARTAESFDGGADKAPQLCVAFTTVQYDCPSRSANIGDACDDGDNTTLNDTVDGICNCVGTPTACTGIGDADGDGVCADADCDDNDPAITTQDTDGDGVCSDVDCDDNDFNIAFQPGDACNDGDNTTINDTVDANCNCVGTPTACTGIGDNDDDGVCSDVDCDDNDPNSTQPGSPCNDGDNTTINDTVDANCNCVGTPTACTGIGDEDDDGICANVDCDDNDPNSTQPGSPCNDGDNTTLNDTVDANCNCVGTPTACTGIGDNDGDGVCSDVDCNDNDPGITTQDTDGDGLCSDVDCDDNDVNIAFQPGDPCNDGNPGTFGETIQTDCSCGGGTTTPSSTCVVISSSSDDAEEEVAGGRMDLNSSDLELCTDGVSQWVGLRFNNLNIPQGANIVSAYLQFEVDESNNDDPCNLTIYGQASDNAATFTAADFDISSRPRTAGSVAWSPPNWASVSDAGPAQQTPGLSAIVQEIVNRSSYSANSSIAFIIEGTGRRVAESFDGPAGGPQLCIDYFDTPPVYDCPSLSAYFGDACDDGDNTTINDTVDNDCNCAGTPTACTGIGDSDGDGVCTGADCDDSDPSVSTQPGDVCDDGDPATINDMLDANCNCSGTLNPCTNIGDNDGDGICADVDCNDNDPNSTAQVGAPCDDGNPGTVGETIQEDCSCGGGSSTPTLSCSIISTSSDDAEEELAGAVDLNSSDLELATDPRSGLQMVGMRFNGLNIPQGAVITSAFIQFGVDESVNDNPCNITIYGQAADNGTTFSGTDFDISGRPRTSTSVSWAPQEWVSVGDAGPAQQTPDLSAIIQEIVDRNGFTSNSSVVVLMDGSGRRTAESADGGSPQLAPELCVEYLSSATSNQPMAPGDIHTGGNVKATREQAVQGSDHIGSINVHPNPANNRLYVSFSSKLENAVQILARDINGRIVWSKTQQVTKGKNTVILEGLTLPDGLYFLQLFADGDMQSAKFVISKD